MTDYDIDLESAPAHGARGEPETGPVEPSETKRGRKSRRAVAKTGVTGAASDYQGEPVRSSECSRWMFHRKGEYCKTCGRTQ